MRERNIKNQKYYCIHSRWANMASFCLAAAIGNYKAIYILRIKSHVYTRCSENSADL